MRRVLIPVATLVLLVCVLSLGLGGPRSAIASTEMRLFPQSGSSAYDVSQYRIRLGIDNRQRRFRGSVSLTATIVRNLDRLRLDAGRNLRIGSVQMGGRRAAFRHTNTKLAIEVDGSPGDQVRLKVDYRGRIRELFDWSGAPYGWVRSGRHGWVTLSAPNVSRLWMPVNDTPADQASYRFSLDVPRGFVGVANGRLVEHKPRPNRDGFVWQLDGEIPPYAALIASGPWRIFHQRGSGVWNVARKRSQLGALRRVRRLQAFLERHLGERPYAPAGGLAIRGMPYALETATRPVYWTRPDGALVVHELAHDWFGNSVALSDWQDVWLNEGPATWFEWLWLEQTGGRSIRNQISGPWCRFRSKWSFPTALPGPRDDIFSGINIYWRGGLVMELLRRKVGNETFYRFLRRWTAENRFSAVDTDRFIALAEAEAGEDLSDVFDPYLFGTEAVWPEALMGFPRSCSGSR